MRNGSANGRMNTMSKSLFSGALLLACSQLISRMLGVVRDSVFASTYGASAGNGIYNLDTYFAAFRLPDLIYNLLIFGALSAAFVPLLTAREQQGQKAVDHLASGTLVAVCGATLVACAVAYVGAVPITHVIAPGLSGADSLQAAALLRIQLLAPIFFSFSAVFGALAQLRGQFAWYAVAPLLYNAGIIAGAYFGGAEYGVYAASWGVAAGAGLHALIQGVGVAHMGFRFRLKRGEHFADQCQLVRLGLPRMGALATQQIQLIIIAATATLLSAKALTVFNFAFNLVSLPLGIVGLSAATVSFGRLSKAAEDPHAFAGILWRGLTSILFWVVPATLGLLILRTDIAELILGRGYFLPMDIAAVAREVLWLSPAIPLLCIVPFVQNAFFAQKNTFTPWMTGLLGLALTLLGAGATVGAGMPLSVGMLYMGASVVSGGWLLALCVWRFGIGGWGWYRAVLRILLAGCVMAGVVGWIAWSWEAAGFWQECVKVLVCTGVGGVVYIGVARVLGERGR